MNDRILKRGTLVSCSVIHYKYENDIYYVIAPNGQKKVFIVFDLVPKSSRLYVNEYRTNRGILVVDKDNFLLDCIHTLL